jgi:hypothetical protein
MGSNVSSGRRKRPLNTTQPSGKGKDEHAEESTTCRNVTTMAIESSNPNSRREGNTTSTATASIGDYSTAHLVAISNAESSKTHDTGIELSNQKTNATTAVSEGAIQPYTSRFSWNLRKLCETIQDFPIKAFLLLLFKKFHPHI